MIIRSIIIIEKYNMITIDQLKIKIEKKSRLLGIDMGAKRIGISICDDKRLVATPLETIVFKSLDNLIYEIKKIIYENDIKGLIIGNPINMDGSFGKSSQSIKDKSNIIAKKIEIPVALWDERLSTVGSFNLSNKLDVNVTKKTKNIDANAAAFILQGAIDYLNN
jgi:putative Holliday junction resolvase